MFGERDRRTSGERVFQHTASHSPGIRKVEDDLLANALDNAPIDEPDDDDLYGGLSEARRAADEGLGITTPQLRHDLGLP